MRVEAERGRSHRPSAASARRYLSLERLVLFAALLSALAFYFREPLTRRQLTFGAAANGTGYQSYLYGDQSNGGSSIASQTPGNPLAWSCLLTAAVQYAYCGFGLVFDTRNSGRGLDLRRYETIRIDLDHRGPGRSLRFVLKNKNPRYAALGAPSAEKVIQTSIAVAGGAQSIELRLDQLAVAEWWRDGASRPHRDLALPEFDNIVSMEILTGVEARPGRHRIAVREIVFEGEAVSPETFYGAILFAWLLLIAGILLQRRREAARWQQQLARSLRTTLDTIPHLVWWLDREGRAHVNARWQDFTGDRESDELLAWWELVHPDERKAVVDMWDECAKSGGSFELECRMKDESGGYRWIAVRAVPSFDEEGGISGWYGTCTDVDDRVAAQRALVDSISSEREKSQQLKWVSEHDALTGLPNRRAFQARLEQATARAVDGGGGVGLLLIDIDHFKHINDSFGHAAGDDLLRALAGRLRESVRGDDFAARLGGDEFAILAEGLQAESDLEAICREVLSAIQAPIELGGHAVRPGASIGGAIFPKDSRNAADFFKAADAALYALKRSGRGGFRFFRAYMLEEVERAALQLAKARLVVAENSIVAHYQPILAVDRGVITGFEALLRYRGDHGALGLPGSLEEAFADYELAAKIGELMQRAVARDVRIWRDKGLAFGRVSINAAPAEFLRDDYAERLLRVLAQHDVPGACIEVEVTEHAFLGRGPEHAARALHLLKQAGVRVALDDFGTGYSSLSHMRDFPVDLIKIDRSFVREIAEDEEIGALVAGVVHLARSLGLQALAEGVETEAQLQLLRSMGCQLAQGHLIGRPVAFEHVSMLVSGPGAVVSAA